MDYSGLTLVTPPSAEPVTIADAKTHARVENDVEDAIIGGYITAARSSAEMILRRALMPQTWRYALKNFPGRAYYGLGYKDLLDASSYAKWNHIDIPLPPLVSIVSFTYTDSAGNVLNMTQGFGNQVGNYLLGLESEPGRVTLPFAGIWPTTVLLPESPILITYICGYPAFNGVVNVDVNGLATWVSGDKFDPGLAGTWVNVGGVSLQCVTVISNTSMQLAATTNPVASNAPYTGNLIPMPIRLAILELVAHYYENREAVAAGKASWLTEVPLGARNLLQPYRILTQ